MEWLQSIDVNGVVGLHNVECGIGNQSLVLKTFSGALYNTYANLLTCGTPLTDSDSYS